VDEKVREAGFFEGGTEGVDEVMGEAAYEADGVHEEYRKAAGKFKTAACGIQGGEKFVFREDLRTGEGVEKCGLACVGIAHYGADLYTLLLALFALGIALAADGFEFFFQAVYALLHKAAVGFEAGFA
jgi:hypothetical protein